MSNNISTVMTINCGFDRQNEITYFAQLSHNEKRELFFRILWGKHRPSYFFDGLENREQDIASIDHISFHDNGTVHIRYYSADKKKEKIYQTKLQNTFLAMPQDTYGPLLIFSIYNVEAFKKHMGRQNSLIFDESHNIQYHWDIQDTHQFSLVFFLVGGDVNYKMMLNTHFPYIFNIATSPFLMNYFGDEKKVVIEDGEIQRVNDLGLLIGYTLRVIPRPPSHSLVGPKKSKEFNRIENVLGLSLVPSDDKIRRLI